MVPWETVRTVAFWMRITGDASGGLAARVKSGIAKKHNRQTNAVGESFLTSINEVFTVHPRRQGNR
jgi:hypothetical protein